MSLDRVCAYRQVVHREIVYGWEPLTLVSVVREDEISRKRRIRCICPAHQTLFCLVNWPPFVLLEAGAKHERNVCFLPCVFHCFVCMERSQSEEDHISTICFCFVTIKQDIKGIFQKDIKLDEALFCLLGYDLIMKCLTMMLLGRILFCTLDLKYFTLARNQSCSVCTTNVNHLYFNILYFF